MSAVAKGLFLGNMDQSNSANECLIVKHVHLKKAII